MTRQMKHISELTDFELEVRVCKALLARWEREGNQEGIDLCKRALADLKERKGNGEA